MLRLPGGLPVCLGEMEWGQAPAELKHVVLPFDDLCSPAHLGLSLCVSSARRRLTPRAPTSYPSSARWAVLRGTLCTPPVREGWRQAPCVVLVPAAVL